MRQATTASAATTTATNAATQRCRTWAAVTSVIAGTSDPFINGQSGKTRAEAVAVTCEPNSSNANVIPVVNAARRVNRWLAPRPPILAG